MCAKSEDQECEVVKEQEIELVEKEQKFSPAKFKVGWAKIITSMSFLAFIIYTAIFTFFLVWILINMREKIVVVNGVEILIQSQILSALNSVFMYILGGGWVATTFVLAISLQKGLESMFANNIKINANIESKFNKLLELKGVADAAQIVSAANK
jgi:hypothetical protein